MRDFYNYFKNNIVKKAPEKQGLNYAKISYTISRQHPAFFCLTTYLAAIGNILILKNITDFKLKTKNPPEKPRDVMAKLRSSQIHTIKENNRKKRS